VSIGSIEPQFYALLIEQTGIDPDLFAGQHDATQWPRLKQILADVFKTKTQHQWCQIMEGTDVCFAPVLNFSEASSHPHNQARRTYINIDGIEQPAPAPRFSRTQAETPAPPPAEGADTEAVLAAWGFDAERIATLRRRGALS
jgi:alpha-methylacyl-CoA racemase